MSGAELIYGVNIVALLLLNRNSIGLPLARSYVVRDIFSFELLFAEFFGGPIKNLMKKHIQSNTQSEEKNRSLSIASLKSSWRLNECINRVESSVASLKSPQNPTFPRY